MILDVYNVFILSFQMTTARLENYHIKLNIVQIYRVRGNMDVGPGGNVIVKDVFC